MIEAVRDIDTLIADLEPWVAVNHPQALVRKFGVGSSDTWKLEARFTGPALADTSMTTSWRAR